MKASSAMKGVALAFAIGLETAAFAETVIYEAPPPAEDSAPVAEVVAKLPDSATNWSGRAWVAIDIANLDGEGGIVRVEPVNPGGRRSKDFRVFEMPVSGSRRVVASVGQFYGVNLKNVRSVRLTLQEGAKRRFDVTRIALSEKGDPWAKSDPPPMPRETVAHGAAMTRFLSKCEAAGSVAGEMAVGIAPAGDAVKPRGDFRAEAATVADVSLARNEYEAFQIVAAPRGSKALKGVKVAVSGDLGLFAASNVTASVMGYVHIKDPAAYKARDFDGKVRWPERTWYPDPILGFLQSADVEPGDVQSFWIRVKCPPRQDAGTYRGALCVTDADGASLAIPFEVRVRDFEIPLAPPFDMAICFNPRYFEAGGKELVADPESPINIWKRHKTEWCDFLAEYFITMDNIYNWGEPDWEVVERLRDKGRLGLFNLGYWSGGSKGAQYTNRTAKARSLGVFEHAYVYGCDELKPKHWAAIENGMNSIKSVEPTLPLLTTTRDDTFGVASHLTNVVFVQDLDFWNPAAVAKAQKDGRKIWWYICSDPKAPGPNVFVECPPVEARLLMGAMAQKFRPDGFLYYALALWRNPRPMTDGPFASWIARNREWYHGDGCLTDCGPDGTPLASQHLENFRDGLEDLWYAKLLQEKLRVVESEKLKAESVGGGEWIRRARAALAVPGELVHSVKGFTVDSDVIHRWRNEIAELIEEAK